MLFKKGCLGSLTPEARKVRSLLRLCWVSMLWLSYPTRSRYMTKLSILVIALTAILPLHNNQSCLTKIRSTSVKNLIGMTVAALFILSLPLFSYAANDRCRVPGNPKYCEGDAPGTTDPLKVCRFESSTTPCGGKCTKDCPRPDPVYWCELLPGSQCSTSLTELVTCSVRSTGKCIMNTAQTGCECPSIYESSIECGQAQMKTTGSDPCPWGQSASFEQKF